MQKFYNEVIEESSNKIKISFFDLLLENLTHMSEDNTALRQDNKVILTSLCNIFKYILLYS